MTTPLSKRRFVLGAAGALAAPLAWACAAPPAAATATRLPALGTAPGVADWQAYLQQPFTLQTPDGASHSVVLSRISPVSGGPGLSQFVLGFDGAAGGQVPAGTYRLQHANGQAMHLYLGSSAGRQSAQLQLRAEFSLLTAKA